MNKNILITSVNVSTLMNKLSTFWHKIIVMIAPWL